MRQRCRAAARHLLAVAALAMFAACRAPVEPPPCAPASALRPICGLRNPEDIVALPDGPWLLASQYRRPGGPPGAIVAVKRDGSSIVPVAGPGIPMEIPKDEMLAANRTICPAPVPPERLEPHGMALIVENHPPWTLLVVNHGARQSVEMFTVTPTAGPPRLEWAGCIPLPPGLEANDVIDLADGALAVTTYTENDSAWHQFLFFARLQLGMNNGRVKEWEHDTGWRDVPGTEGTVPNGIAVSSDGRRLFVADWGSSRLLRVDRTGAEPSRSVPLPHHPDNLSWASDGRLLIAGHVGSVLKAFRCLDGNVMSCAAPWSVIAVDPETLAATTLREGDGADFGAASSALAVGDTIFVGSWGGDRMIRLPAPRAADPG